jgi:hypothetical protein
MKPARYTLQAAAAVLALVALADRGQAAEPVLEAKAIERMSETATTASDHARVARQYRLRAESLEAKAADHEKEARRLRAVHNPMATKWPAMGRAAEDRETRLAMQARRAAQECYARANRHINLAVEAELAE